MHNSNDAIALGVAYLQQHQYPNGEFCTYISGDDAMLEWNYPDSSIFPSALIGNSLLFLKEKPFVKEILDKTVAFLHYQMGRGGTWHHFTRQHPLFAICPFDVDDTACVSAFLKEYDSDILLGSNIPLILNNRNSQGLFYTWFTSRLRWNTNKTYWKLVLREVRHPLKTFFFWRKMECSRYDVDAVVNVNVLYYLGECASTQPVLQYLIEIINTHKEADCDKWYRNPFTVYYFISRTYNKGITTLEPVRKPILERVLAKTQANGSFGETVLDTALAVCTLLNFNYEGPQLKKATDFIRQSQHKNGSWQRWRLYYGGPKKLTGYGSEELTTAFCLEALARYQVSDPVSTQ